MTATIAVHEFISADGVFESPSWTFEFGFDPAMGETLAGVTGSATAILLGRTTFDMFAPAWRDRTVEQDPGAPFFNETTKYVVGEQEPAEEWGPSERLGAYDPNAIRRLKDDTEGSIYVSGSGRLVRGLLADGLVDELHLFVYPVGLGEGPYLVPPGTPKLALGLLSATPYENGVVHLTYGPAAA